MFITEGDSASGSITKSRNVNTQAVFSLRGKPLNSYGMNKKIVYENEEFNLLQAVLEEGMQSSISDAGVGALCARTAVVGAYFNVRINAKDIKDRVFAEAILAKSEVIYKKSIAIEKEVMDFIFSKV